MKIETFTLGSFMVNCFLVTSDDDGEAVLIDAPEEIETVLDVCDARGLEPGVLVNTHGHVDHIFGNEVVKRHWPGIQLAIHADDGPKLDSALRNLSLLMGMSVKSPPADRLLTEGDRIDFGDESLEVLHVPGHSAGGIALVARPKNSPPVVFTGDTLMAMSVGRTDFPGCSWSKLETAIREKLLTLPDDTVCYCGHGPTTTIGLERRNNPFFNDD
ncbi:MAG: MBL fold metallo-hydrolase [Planctomycetes bacterium]|nr:MBL fold metallo-hydrolase [Planctomycetota bacterium]